MSKFTKKFFTVYLIFSLILLTIFAYFYFFPSIILDLILLIMVLCAFYFILFRVSYYIIDLERKKILNSLPVPIFLINGNGEFEIVNRNFINFFGKKRCDFELEIIKKAMKVDIVLEKEKKLKGKNRFITQLEIKDSHGNLRIIDILKSFIYEDENLKGMLGIIFDVTQQTKLTEVLYNQTIKDELTGAFNRRFLYHIFPVEKERALRNNYKISVIMFDIDDFKKINDNFGHQIGDYVLKTLCEVIKKNIRKYDYLFRIGGEEFVILLINADINNAYKVAEKLRKIVEEYKFDERFRVTISLGVAEVFENDTLNDVLERADKAMYKAKSLGKNKVA